MASQGGGSQGGGKGFGPPRPPAKPAGATGAQGDGTSGLLHGSAGAQADGTAPPLHGSASGRSAAATGYVGVGAIRPQMRGAAGAGSRATSEVNINTGYVGAGAGAIRPQMRGAAGAGSSSRELNVNTGVMPVQSDRPVTLSSHGNDGTGTRTVVHMSTQPEQGVRMSNVAHAPANPPGRHDPSRVVSQNQTGAGSSSSSVAQGVAKGIHAQEVVSQNQTGAGSSSSVGADLLAQAIHSQMILECRPVVNEIEHLTRSRQWNVLEEYLRQIISMSGSNVDQHPRLLLYCRRGWLISLLQGGFSSLAIRFHQGYVAPLRHVRSLFTDPEETRSQLDVIWGSMTRDPGYAELLASHPGNIVDLIMDYMRLHFPEVVGHINPAGTTNQFWAFGVHLGRDRESKKVKLRCVFCQHLMTSDRVGLDMAKHLRQSCPKMTTHWRAKVEALSRETAIKKRPRAAESKQAGPSKVALPSWKKLISTEAHQAIGTLTRLPLNEVASFHAMILRGELEAIAQLGNEPFFLAGRLEAAVSALQDLMAALMLEGEEARSTLKELTVPVYKLQFLIPYCLALVSDWLEQQQHVAVPSTQQQQQHVPVPSTQQQQQQHVPVPSTQQQQQQQVVAVPSAVPQEQVVPVPSAVPQEQEPVVVAPSAGEQDPVVAAQQDPVVVAPLAGEQEQVVVPLMEALVNDVNDQNVQEDHADQGDVNDQNVQEEHADQGGDPFNILIGPAELDQLLQIANQFLEAGQGHPPPPV